ncbi:MAG: P1 family peptidase [Firmicutes bacterium]|nr:P1 family peptidase [Bacillota bacterium]MBQ3123148.1 P1 family peptidase [Bacillota bacterium]MBQ9971943.1 P1 family peptidase [Bacillota bacterium]
MKEISITEIEGILIGNAQDEKGATGCTAIICKEGASAGVDVRGAAPATRETDLLKSVNMVQQIHCVMLSGGSAFGLAAGNGAMEFLSERNIGFDTGVERVPIVCGASLFDLDMGEKRHPDLEMGYEACRAAFDKDEIRQGNYGAGTGATVGKWFGAERMMKGGLGIYAAQVGSIKCAAVVAVNCLGDVYDTDTGKVIAGVMNEEKSEILSTDDFLLRTLENPHNLFNGNTTIGCIITNAKLTKPECNKLASVTHNAYARAISPVHTSADGDSIFVMATGEIPVMADALGVLSVHVMEKAIANAVKNADNRYGVKTASDF